MVQTSPHFRDVTPLGVLNSVLKPQVCFVHFVSQLPSSSSPLFSIVLPVFKR